MDWCTPQDFFDRLNEEFGFVLDAAATDKTAKCTLYYTPETDGLSQSWDRGGAVFCNPPYGREIGKGGKKAYEEARGGGGGVRRCTAYSRSNRYDLFSRLHIRESGNPFCSRAASLHGRRRERQRSRALPFYGSYL
jgi:phage N-6-adenine-methyltransferase